MSSTGAALTAEYLAFLHTVCLKLPVTVKTLSFHKHKSQMVFLLQPSSSLWSPQSLSPSHCHWAGMHVHSPKALTAHVKWLRPQEHSVLLDTPAKEQKEKDVLKTWLYFMVHALNTNWRYNCSPRTHSLHEHTLSCKEKHSSLSHCWNRRSSTIHSFLEWSYLKTTANSNLPKRDLGIS